MDKKSKIILLTMIIVVLIIIGIAAFFMMHGVQKESEKFVTQANDNSGVIEEKEVSGLKISNVMLVVKEEGSTFTADVTNITDKEIKGNLNIKFKTGTNKEVINMLGYFGESIKPGETKKISSNTSRRLSKNIIKSVDYKLNQ